MPVNVVVDTQWGDGGKGKLIDLMALDAHLVIRFNGGANAGYTVVAEGKTHKLHLLPAGILHEGKMNVVGPGVVFDLAVGHEEILLARKNGARLMLDRSTPVVLPIHRAIDLGRELAAGSTAIGTTKRGIGPCYEDYTSRRGITLGDLNSYVRIEQALLRGGYWNEKVALARHLGLDREDLSDLKLGIDPMDLKETIRWCHNYGQPAFEHLGDTRAFVHEMFTQQKQLLFQGVNSVLLDVTMGARPYCTSSICTPAGISATFGIYKFDRVIGIVKAYNTRVGGGPFPTELKNEIAEQLRARGQEYGTTTGRPRRCGWLDLPATKYGCRMSGVRELVVTKLDVLSGLPDLFVCRSYESHDELTSLTSEVLEGVRPVLTPCATWDENLAGVRTLGDLPPAAQRYIQDIRLATNLPITAIGVGPDRFQFIWT